MYLLYDIAVHITTFILKITAFFNKKIGLFISGRKETFSRIANGISENDRVIWFHCASLGEFEQGRPILEAVKRKYPKYKILLSFFSPSGYEVQKNYDIADVVTYLPLDTQKNAEKFIRLAHPELVLFVKYEFWPNILKELQKKHIETLLISGIFRKDQAFFKSYGRWMRKSLKAFSHFFVQNKASKSLLGDIGFNNCTVSGDTRFDRVFEIREQDNHLEFIENFKQDHYLLVAGSTWPEDEDLLVHYINNRTDPKEKIVIAPHNIDRKRIEAMRRSIKKKTVLYSEKNREYTAQVFIADTIGILTKIYSYADTAYVGGGFGKEGVHNILEPATFGVPIVMGPIFQNFKEAVDLTELGGSIVVKDQATFDQSLKELYKNTGERIQKGGICKNYILKNRGATKIIMDFISKKL